MSEVNQTLDQDIQFALPQTLEKLDFKHIATLKKEEIRSVVEKIQRYLEQGETVELPVKHHFSRGVYVRELEIPKGTLLVGRIHKFQNMTILTKGECTVLSIDGLVNIKAPATFVSSPGVKRVIWASEDTTWMTVHENPTEEKDPEKLVESLTVKNYSELQEPETLEIKSGDQL